MLCTQRITRSLLHTSTSADTQAEEAHLKKKKKTLMFLNILFSAGSDVSLSERAHLSSRAGCALDVSPAPSCHSWASSDTWFHIVNLFWWQREHASFRHPFTCSQTAEVEKERERVRLPVEAVHHLEMHPQVLLREVVQHACVHQALHEVAAVLR